MSNFLLDPAVKPRDDSIQRENLKIGIVAGEASGDVLGAKLIHALKEQFPHATIEGLGGPAMIAAGCNSLFDIERLAVMGFIEPLLRLPDLIKLRWDLLRYFQKNRPDIFIGVDAPDFNIGLEKKLRQSGIPVIHYVSPSVWAWRQYRVHKIAKAIDLMLTLLPFEAKFYEQYHVPVKYVGHPLAEQIPLHPDKKAARRALCVPEEGAYIALLPGSRKQELRYIGPTFLQSAQLLFKERKDLQFLTSHVNEQRYQHFYSQYKKIAPELPLHFFTRRSHDVMAAADAVIVTSGTATLETMLYKKPMVIAYKMSNWTYKLATLLVKIRFAGLPNLLANDLIVPELFQEQATPEAISRQILSYLDHPDHVERLQKTFLSLHKDLRKDSSHCISKAISDLLNKK